MTANGRHARRVGPGLDEDSRVWQWNAKEARWRPHKLEAKPSSNDRSPNEGRRSDDAPF